MSDLIELLREFAVASLVDIRAVPRSRRNPQFNTDHLATALPAAGIAYSHLPALGGLRGRQKEVAGSPNTLWRHSGFRNYADYALTSGFADGLQELERIARGQTLAIMCAEAVWWRCHRRIVADYLLVGGHPVTHILGPGKSEPAALTPGAERQSDGRILYPGPAPELPL